MKHEEDFKQNKQEIQHWFHQDVFLFLKLTDVKDNVE